MNILAVDFGTKNIGLAWCDTGIGVVFPFGVIKSEDKNKAKKDLLDFVKKEHVDQLVVGLPLSLDGKENKNTERIRDFFSSLDLKIKLDFFDERFTSRQADRSEGGASRDEKSAMVILESYLQKNKK
ncbi:MAG: Holliday junction resolvase RuvX [Candidatus Magasanikbacteria bacterium]